MNSNRAKLKTRGLRQNGTGRKIRCLFGQARLLKKWGTIDIDTGKAVLMALGEMFAE